MLQPVPLPWDMLSQAEEVLAFEALAQDTGHSPIWLGMPDIIDHDTCMTEQRSQAVMITAAAFSATEMMLMRL